MDGDIADDGWPDGEVGDVKVDELVDPYPGGDECGTEMLDGEGEEGLDELDAVDPYPGGDECDTDTVDDEVEPWLDGASDVCGAELVD